MAKPVMQWDNLQNFAEALRGLLQEVDVNLSKGKPNSGRRFHLRVNEFYKKRCQEKSSASTGVESKRLSNTPVPGKRFVLKFPDERRTEGFITQNDVHALTRRRESSPFSGNSSPPRSLRCTRPIASTEWISGREISPSPEARRQGQKLKFFSRWQSRKTPRLVWVSSGN